LNVCGWTTQNHNLRAGIINSIDADIVTVCETHLLGSNIIELEGFNWFGFNRPTIQRNAPKASGGVGILVKGWISEQFNITVVDKSYDGILALKFVHRETEGDFIVFSCYLPPENSNRGRDAQSFFAHLLSQIYINSESDKMFIGADFNSRIGSLTDIIDDCDNIPERKILDKSTNQHGQDFIEFLNDAKFCILNGRFDS
jgi:hypothetical protein